MFKAGIDAGTNSCAVAYVDPAKREIVHGMVVFPEGVEPRKYRPNNEERRLKRLSRRTLRRRAARKSAIRNTLCRLLKIDLQALRDWYGKNTDLFEIRSQAATRKIGKVEFAATIIHLNNNRGPNFYVPNVAQEDEDGDEVGIFKQKIRSLRTAVATSGKTVGQILASYLKEHGRVHNQGEDYLHIVHRDMIRAEFDVICDKQKYLNKSQRAEVAKILFSQLPTRWDMASVGRCGLHPSDHCLSVRSSLAQRFVMLKQINDIRIGGKALTKKQRERLVELFSSRKKITRGQLAKSLNVEEQFLPERSTYNGNWFENVMRPIMKRLEPHCHDSFERELQKLDDSTERAERFRRIARSVWGMDEDDIECILGLSLPKGRISFSARALRNLLPYMDEGQNDREAIKSHSLSKDISDDEKSRYSFDSSTLNKKDRRILAKGRLPKPPVCHNPSARRTMYAVRDIMQYMIDAYGIPASTNIEVARELKNSAEKRLSMTKQMATSQKRREQIAAYIEKSFKSPLNSRSQWERAELWFEQHGVCAYSGHPIDLRDIGEIEVEHIIPKAFAPDNSLSNKVLCYKKFNHNKGKRLPFQWLNAADFENLMKRFEHLKRISEFHGVKIPKNSRKLEKLKLQTPPENQFSNGQLTATAWATKQMGYYLRDTLHDCDSQKVLAISGQVTSELRRMWGLPHKDRSTHIHHLEDAILLACVDRYVIKAITVAYQENKECELPPPWPGFAADVKKICDSVIVKHHQRWKVGSKSFRTVALHNDTILGYSSDGVYTKRQSIKNLSVANLIPLGVPNVGLVKDEAFRNHLIGIITQAGINVHDVENTKTGRDKIKAEILKLAENGAFVFNDKPIRKFTSELKNSKVIAIDVKDRSGNVIGKRYHQTDGNHHGIIYEANGKWVLEAVSNYEAARRHTSGSLVFESPPNLVMHLVIGSALLIEGKIWIVKEIHNNVICVPHWVADPKNHEVSLSSSKMQKVNAKKVEITFGGAYQITQ